MVGLSDWALETLSFFFFAMIQRHISAYKPITNVSRCFLFLPKAEAGVIFPGKLRWFGANTGSGISLGSTVRSTFFLVWLWMHFLTTSSLWILIYQSGPWSHTYHMKMLSGLSELMQTKFLARNAPSTQALILNLLAGQHWATTPAVSVCVRSPAVYSQALGINRLVWFWVPVLPCLWAVWSYPPLPWAGFLIP